MIKNYGDVIKSMLVLDIAIINVKEHEVKHSKGKSQPNGYIYPLLHEFRHTFVAAQNH